MQGHPAPAEVPSAQGRPGRHPRRPDKRRQAQQTWQDERLTIGETNGVLWSPESLRGPGRQPPPGSCLQPPPSEGQTGGHRALTAHPRLGPDLQSVRAPQRNEETSSPREAEPGASGHRTAPPHPVPRQPPELAREPRGTQALYQGAGTASHPARLARALPGPLLTPHRGAAGTHTPHTRRGPGPGCLPFSLLVPEDAGSHLCLPSPGPSQRGHELCVCARRPSRGDGRKPKRLRASWWLQVPRGVLARETQHNLGGPD